MMQRMGIRAPILLIGGICITMTMEPVLTLVMISVLPLITLVVWLVSPQGIPMYGYLQKGIDMMVRTVGKHRRNPASSRHFPRSNRKRSILRRSMLRWFAAKAALPSAWASPTR